MNCTATVSQKGRQLQEERQRTPPPGRQRSEKESHCPESGMCYGIDFYLHVFIFLFQTPLAKMTFFPVILHTFIMLITENVHISCRNYTEIPFKQ